MYCEAKFQKIAIFLFYNFCCIPRVLGNLTHLFEMAPITWMRRPLFGVPSYFLKMMIASIFNFPRVSRFQGFLWPYFFPSLILGYRFCALYLQHEKQLLTLLNIWKVTNEKNPNLIVFQKPGRTEIWGRKKSTCPRGKKRSYSNPKKTILFVKTFFKFCCFILKEEGANSIVICQYTKIEKAKNEKCSPYKSPHQRYNHHV